MMQLFQTEDHYILHDGDYSLWCSRHYGTLEAKQGDDICSAWNPVCIGLIYGLIGKIKLHPDSSWRLILIKEKSLVGRFANKHEIYKINKIVIIPLSREDPQELDLDLCKIHHFGIKKSKSIASVGGSNQKQLQNAWKTIKTGMENVKQKKKEDKDKEKFLKRILEELFKLYNDSDSFFICDTFDLTNTIQRQYSQDYNQEAHLWQNADSRFFWNSHMIKELLDCDTDKETYNLCCHWAVPVIQGFIQIENCILDFDKSPDNVSSDLSPEYGTKKVLDPLEFTLVLISRRSIHRAGTRSKKRGLDETGACANYVETEQILQFYHHLTSFVQVRGSVPVYWSQSGLKYRPPPKLDRGEQEAHEAFCLHFKEQLRLYKAVTAINLAELVGKEKALSDAYLHHVLRYNSPDINYVMFDFHEYCRGMKFENVTMLTDGIKDIIRNTRYCWVDSKGMICEQTGVFRVNCVDCLDRTNVVQTAIARIVMDTQLRKLGVLPPDEVLPPSCKKIFQQIWANNGDAISRQYAGTAALKGDFTRTGERKLSGMMKDGMNSANRYYLRFRDSYRQAAIDLSLGRTLSEEVLLQTNNKTDEVDGEEDTNDLLEKEENLRQLLEDCKRMLIVEPEECMGGWCLINADPVTGDDDRQDMDVILLLSQRAVYVAWYDDDEEQITQYQRIFLEDIEKIEIGAEPAIFKSKFVCLRLHYRHYADEGFFHTFRIPTMRLFNNMIVVVRNQEDAKEILKAVYQGFAAAQEILSLQLPLEDRPKLDRKKTKRHPDVQDIHQQQQEQTLSNIHIPRDVSTPEISSRKFLNLPGSGSKANSSRTPESSPSQAKKPLFKNLPNMSDIKKNINIGIKSIPRLSFKSSGKTQDSVETGLTSDGANESDVELSVNASSRKLCSQGSKDDSEVEDKATSHRSEMDRSIVLESCGIVSSGSKLMKEVSHDEVDGDEKETGNLPCINSADLNNEENIVQMRHRVKGKSKLSKTEGANSQNVNESNDSDGVMKDETEEIAESEVPLEVQRRMSQIVPNLTLPQQKTRRIQRILDNIQLDIQSQLTEEHCISHIIFI